MTEQMLAMRVCPYGVEPVMQSRSDAVIKYLEVDVSVEQEYLEVDVSVEKEYLEVDISVEKEYLEGDMSVEKGDVSVDYCGC
jgi:hypothetical protein